MKLIQFSTTSGQVWINPEHVAVVEVLSEQRAMIRTASGGEPPWYTVNSPAEAVAGRLQGLGDV